MGHTLYKKSFREISRRKANINSTSTNRVKRLIQEMGKKDGTENFKKK